MAIRIRKAKTEDAERMADLWHEMAMFHARLGEEWRIRRGSKPGFAKYITKVVDEREAGVFVAHDDGRIVGFVVAQAASRARIFVRKDHGLIADLAVTRAYRRRGVGEKLCRRALRWIAARGLDTAEVRFATSNPLATAFWRKMGFDTYMVMATKPVAVREKKSRIPPS